MNRRDFLKTTLLTTGGLLLANLFAGAATETSRVPTTRRVRLGIDMLEAENFARLRGEKVGLVTNQAGVNRYGESTIRVLHTRGRRAGVNLVALFGPEHGIYGDVPAEKIVADQKDTRLGTKLPVFSLYGGTRRPTPEMLRGITKMVIDLQDVGSRSYTFVSCMRLVMEACFEAGIPVLVLDRPNPLGGLKTDGPMLDDKWQSYVGMYPVPYVHGLTIGELARAALHENWLKLSEKARSRAKLDVVKMGNWKRSMLWRDTGLDWIPTSPYIANPDAAEGYAMTGLGCCIGKFSHTFTASREPLRLVRPFRFLGYPGKNEREMADLVNSFRIAGLRGVPAVLGNGTAKGALLAVSDWRIFRPTEISFHMMRQCCAWGKRNPFADARGNDKSLFLKHLGDEKFFNALCREGAKIDIKAWCSRWEARAAEFRRSVADYRLYA
ncbi:MAG: DUF1343 domain-containing protein [Verrucomicrobia bacterium]|nr:DUF1343 domain-containing protein [Verrucomicrobiota bacterium]